MPRRFIGRPSSGFAFQGLLNYLEQAGDELPRNKNGEVICVFIACDSPFPYLNEYFEYLDDNLFPTVQNAELLTNHSQVIKKQQFSDVSQFEITVHQAYGQLFDETSQQVWTKLLNYGTVELKDKMVVVDTRVESDFQHFHIPNAINIELADLEQNIQQHMQLLRDKQVIVVCYRGNTSKLATALLRHNQVTAYTVRGGMTEWSKENLPRWRPDICIK